MAFGIGNVATFTWAGSVDLSPYVKSIDIKANRDIKKLPRLGGNQTASLPGPVDTEITLEGWYDPAVAAVFAAAAFSTVLTAYGWEATMEASAESYSGSAYVGSFNPSVDSEEPNKFSVTLAPDQGGVTYSPTT